MGQIVKIDFSRLRQKELIIMDEIGTLMKQEMLNRAPQETGEMRMSIEKKMTGGNGQTIELEIGTNGIPYAAHIEYGTIPHEIPNAFGRGITVMHPGTPIAPPEMPIEVWDALIKRNEIGSGQTIPFARSADFFTRNQQKEIFGKVFHK